MLHEMELRVQNMDNEAGHHFESEDIWSQGSSIFEFDGAEFLNTRY